MKPKELTEASFNYNLLYFYSEIEYWLLMKAKRRVQMRRRSLRSQGLI